MIKCKGWLIAKTGIGNGNYKYASSKGELDGWFKSKSIGEFTDYSIVHAENPDKNHFNVACVHLNLKHNKTTEIDYIGWQNDDDDRIYWGSVITRERVNENSTRIYFCVDYVASFYDDIQLGKCFVERDHSKLEPYENLLPEPINTTKIINLYDKGKEIRERIEKILQDFEYTIIASATPDGKIEPPKMNFQSGGSIGGLIYNGDASYCENLFKQYLTTSNLPLATMHSFMTFIKAVYMAPKVVTQNKSKDLYNDTEVIELLSLDDIKCKHPKTLNYITYHLAAQSGSMEIAPWQYGVDGNVIIEIRMTGGVGGRVTYTPRFYGEKKTRDTQADILGNYTQYVCSAEWPSIGIAGFDKQTIFSVNPSWSKASNQATNEIIKNNNYDPLSFGGI